VTILVTISNHFTW